MGLFTGHRYPYTDFHEMNLDWVISKMNDLIEEWRRTTKLWEDTQSAFEDLKQYVTDWFKEDHVKNYVYSKIEEMAKDGTLAAIIAQVIREQAHVCVTYFGKLPYKRSSDAGMQGAAYLGDDVIVQYSSLNQTLEKFNIKTGSMINVRSGINLGHCNSLFYNPDTDKIYAYGVFLSDHPTRVIVLNSGTLEIEEQFDLVIPETDMDDDTIVPTINNIGYAMSYSPENKCYYVFGQFLTSLPNAKSYIMRYNSNFEFEKMVKINPGSFGFDIACVTASDKIYILSNDPIWLYEYTLDMDYYRLINVDPVVNNLMTMTEPESVNFYNGDLIVGYLTHSMTGYGGGSYNYGTIKLSEPYIGSNVSKEEFTDVATVFVDFDNSRYDRNGSSANPFQTIYEALNCAYNLKSILIVDNTNGPTDSFIIASDASNCHLRIGLSTSTLKYGVYLRGVTARIGALDPASFPRGENNYFIYMDHESNLNIDFERTPNTLEATTILSDASVLTMTGRFYLNDFSKIEVIHGSQIFFENDIPVIVSNVIENTNLQCARIHRCYEKLANTVTALNNLQIPKRCTLRMQIQGSDGSYRDIFYHLEGNNFTVFSPNENGTVGAVVFDGYTSVTDSYCKYTRISTRGLKAAGFENLGIMNLYVYMP